MPADSIRQPAAAVRDAERRIRGLPLDEHEPPSWTDEYLTPRQRSDLLPRTKWIVLIDAAAVTSTAHHAALRLQLYTAGQETHVAFPSIPTLARQMKVEDGTARRGTRELEQFGWLRIDVDDPSDPNRPGVNRQGPNRYTLCWPETDVMVRPAAHRQCREMTANGRPCRRRAGWGTEHDDGPCKLHRHAGGVQPMHPTGPTVAPVMGSTDAGGRMQPVKPSALASSLGGVQPISAAADDERRRSRAEQERSFADALRAQGLSEREITAYLDAQRRRLAS